MVWAMRSLQSERTPLFESRHPLKLEAVQAMSIVQLCSLIAYTVLPSMVTLQLVRVLQMVANRTGLLGELSYYMSVKHCGQDTPGGGLSEGIQPEGFAETNSARFRFLVEGEEVDEHGYLFQLKETIAVTAPATEVLVDAAAT
eukprot:3936845-Amphidinium_carterae.2